MTISFPLLSTMYKNKKLPFLHNIYESSHKQNEENERFTTTILIIDQL